MKMGLSENKALEDVRKRLIFFKIFWRFKIDYRLVSLMLGVTLHYSVFFIAKDYKKINYLQIKYFY